MSGSTLSLPAAPAGTVPSRWRIARDRLGDPAIIIMAMAAAILLFLVLYPVFWLFYGSFSYGEQGFGAALAQLWQLPGLARAVTNTLWLVAGTVPLAFVFALPLVWITARTDTPLKGRDRSRGADSLHHAAPDRRRRLVAARRAADRGDQRVRAHARRDRAGAEHLYDRWAHLRDVALSQSLRVPHRQGGDVAHGREPGGRLADLRRGVGKTVWYVLIPLSLPAILSAGILVLTRALEEFAIPGVLGAPSGIYTVTTYIYYQAVSYIPPRYEVAALLATALMGVTAFCLGLQAWLLGGGRRFTTVSGKGHPPRLAAPRTLALRDARLRDWPISRSPSCCPISS